MPSLAWPGPGPCLLPVHCPDPLSRQLSLSPQHLLVNTVRNSGHLRDSPICFWWLFLFVSGPASRGRVSVSGPGRAGVSCSAEFQELGSIRFYSELAALAAPSPARQQQARSRLASLDGFLGTDKTKLHYTHQRQRSGGAGHRIIYGTLWKIVSGYWNLPRMSKCVFEVI